jgi:tRNA dimethylallyltransferase
LISLEPASRGWLHQRIAERFGQMLGAGFWNEVLALRRRGDLHDALPAIRSVGYRQAWALAGRLEAAGRNAEAPDLALLNAEGIAATRQLAKRQLTWLRSMPERTPVAADDPAAADIAARQVEAAVG